jgi:hypothetical protein
MKELYFKKMESELYFIIEKENKEIKIFDIIDLNANLNHNHLMMTNPTYGDITIKTTREQGIEIIGIWEIMEDIYNKYDIQIIKIINNDIKSDKYLSNCAIIGWEFIDTFTEITFSVDYEKVNTFLDSANLIKSFKRDQKLKSIGI